MNTEYRTVSPAEIAEYEHQARQMRAEALAATARQVWTWFRHLGVAHRPAAHH